MQRHCWIRSISSDVLLLFSVESAEFMFAAVLQDDVMLWRKPLTYCSFLNNLPCARKGLCRALVLWGVTSWDSTISLLYNDIWHLVSHFYDLTFIYSLYHPVCTHTEPKTHCMIGFTPERPSSPEGWLHSSSSLSNPESLRYCRG